MRRSASLLVLGWSLSALGAESAPVVHMLVPGFTVRELPVRLPNINNLRFAPDGRLAALAYDGRVWLLRDTDGDGLEDTAEPFWDKTTISVPVGMAWSTTGLYVSSHGKVSLLRDTDGDGKADVEEIIASSWPPTDVGSGGVDATGVTLDAEGNVYFGLIAADYSNPYRVKDGVSHYDLNGLRGTIQKWYAKTRTLETVANGIRVPFALRFNQAGDLFCTDQEGETWCPNGNPLDELNHIVPGRNYGFPPRHEKWLPSLVSEPPVVAFGPQHQSTCGLIFNEPHGPLNQKPEIRTQQPALPASPAQGLFGPKWWEGDAFIAGESRGKIWRVRLVKTSHGYVGKEYTIARLSMLTMDLAISPKGDLYVCCHSGVPDWGTGPAGEGKILKISYTGLEAPQPVVAWPASSTEVRVAFDKALDPGITNQVRGMRLEFGEYVRAADRYEFLKPPYQAVKNQEATPRGKLNVVGATLDNGGKTLVLTTDPHPAAVHYALIIPGVRARGRDGKGEMVDVDYDLSGVRILWSAKPLAAKFPIPVRQPALNLGIKFLDEAERAERWMPYPDLAVSEKLLHPLSVLSEDFGLPEGKAASTGILVFRMEAPKDAQTIHLSSTNLFIVTPYSFQQGPARLNPNSREYEFEFPAQNVHLSKQIYVKSVGLLAPISVDYRAAGGGYFRPVPLGGFLPEWAPLRPASSVPPQTKFALLPGDWLNGKDLFFGDRLKCSTCHTIRGEGGHVGPDLGIVVQRDVVSVLRDIKEPSASINPDYVAYNVALKGGGEITGFIKSQDTDALSVVGADGREMKVPRADMQELRVSAVSLMPTGLLDGLNDTQVGDLLTFLLNEPPKRSRSDVEVVLKAADIPHSALRTPPLNIVLVASKQDHGVGQHDYPVWQKKWGEWLGRAPGVKVEDAWLWPTPGQFQSAGVIVFYFWNHDWSAERYRQLDEFFARGGGIVLLHSATIADKDPERMAEFMGLAWQPGRSKYRHTPLDLKIVSTANSPITRGLPSEIHFLDEPYWPLIGDTHRVQVLASAVEDGQDQPLVWTFQRGKGRVFGCVLGHFTWTLDDPLYRLIVLRGMSWAAGDEVARFDSVVAKGW
ncbi:MAG: ThuA domain-containing protein [Limisphaerales bacterium]